MTVEDLIEHLQWLATKCPNAQVLVGKKEPEEGGELQVVSVKGLPHLGIIFIKITDSIPIHYPRYENI